MTSERGSAFTGQPGQRLTVWLHAHDRAGHRSLQVELLRRVQQAGVAGATVFQAEEGFDALGRPRRSGLISDDAPRALVVVDRPGQMQAFLEEVRDLLEGVTFTVEDVEIIDLGPDPTP
jgi:hypothetical protein